MPEAIFKNAVFCRVLEKLQNWVKFSIFSYLKFFSVFIAYGGTILFSKHILELLWSICKLWGWAHVLTY